METNERLLLTRQRSTGAVISDGYKLFFANIWTIIKRTWILAIVYAIVCGLIGCHACMNMLPKMMTTDGMHLKMSDMWGEIGILTAYELLFLLMAVLIISQVLSMFREHMANGTITCHSVWKQVVPLKVKPKGFRKVFRHLGLIFAVLLVTFIISLIACLLMEAPALYITEAHIEAQKSMAIGDPNGLPASIGVLTFLSFAISGFFQAYIHTSALFPFYYAYGKIKFNT